MSDTFKKTTRELVKAGEAYSALQERWYQEAKAYADQHGRDTIAGGMTPERLLYRLKIHVLAELPKWLKIDGSGDARRYLKFHPGLPGLGK